MFDVQCALHTYTTTYSQNQVGCALVGVSICMSMAVVAVL